MSQQQQQEGPLAIEWGKIRARLEAKNRHAIDIALVRLCFYAGARAAYAEAHSAMSLLKMSRELREFDKEMVPDDTPEPGSAQADDPRSREASAA